MARDTPRDAEHRRAANEDVHRLAAAFTQYRHHRPLPRDDLYRVRLIGVGQLPVALTDLGRDDMQALITYLTTTPIPAISAASAPDGSPSPEDIEAARTPAGGWTRETLRGWGVPWPPPSGWRHDLLVKWQRAHADPTVDDSPPDTS